METILDAVLGSSWKLFGDLSPLASSRFAVGVKEKVKLRRAKWNESNDALSGRGRGQGGEGLKQTKAHQRVRIWIRVRVRFRKRLRVRVRVS